MASALLVPTKENTLTDNAALSAAPLRRPPDLLIRAARVGDFEAITALSNLPLYRAGTNRLPYQRPEQARKWLENLADDAVNLVAVLDGEIVGQGGFERQRGRRSHAAILGLGVHDDHQGRGIGTALLEALLDAADRWHDIRRLELTVFADNRHAIHLYETFGFEHEGVLRAFAFRDGAYADVLNMARLRL
jgi:putative acetyltransferase